VAELSYQAQLLYQAVMSELYYYASNGEQLGPLDSNELCRLYHSGAISDATFVWTDGKFRHKNMLEPNDFKQEWPIGQ
jgi:hypothetical protein